MTFTRLALVAPLLLIACAEMAPIGEEPGLSADDPAQAELTLRECAIYFAAAAQLEAEGRDAPSRLTRGCPAEAEGRAVDISAMVSPPPMMSGYPTTLDARMRSRGMPSDLADQISRSKAFWDLVARRDSILAGF